MYHLKSEKINYGINIPTTIEEVKGYMSVLTSELNIPEHYAVVGIAYKTTLSDIAIEIRKTSKIENVVSVLPIIVKVNTQDDNLKTLLEPGSIPILSSADIEMGTRFNSGTRASKSALFEYFSQDDELRTECFKRSYKGNVKDKGGDIDNIEEVTKDNYSPIYCIDFKIIPISAIKGVRGLKAIHDPALC